MEHRNVVTVLLNFCWVRNKSVTQPDCRTDWYRHFTLLYWHMEAERCTVEWQSETVELLMSAKQIRHSVWLWNRLKKQAFHTVVMDTKWSVVVSNENQRLLNYCWLQNKFVTAWLSDWLIPVLHTGVLARRSRALYCWMRTRECRASAECETNPSHSLTVGPTDTDTSHRCNGTWKWSIVLANENQRLLMFCWLRNNSVIESDWWTDWDWHLILL